MYYSMRGAATCLDLPLVAATCPTRAKDSFIKLSFAKLLFGGLEAGAAISKDGWISKDLEAGAAI